MEHVDNFFIDGNASLACSLNFKMVNGLQPDIFSLTFRINPYAYYDTLFTSKLKTGFKNGRADVVPNVGFRQSIIKKVNPYWVIGLSASIKGDGKKLDTAATLASSYNIEKHHMQVGGRVKVDPRDPLKVC